MALYRLNPPSDLDGLLRQCESAQENPNRRKFDHSAAFERVERDGVTVAVKDAGGKVRYGEGAPGSGGGVAKALPIVLAGVLGLLVIRKVRS